MHFTQNGGVAALTAASDGQEPGATTSIHVQVETSAQQEMGRDRKEGKGMEGKTGPDAVGHVGWQVMLRWLTVGVTADDLGRRLSV